VLSTSISGEFNLDCSPLMIRTYLENAQTMISRVPYHFKWLVVYVEDSPVAIMGLNQLWVPSTINKYCMKMNKLLITMVRSRNNNSVDDKPFINFLAICIWILQMHWKISFLISNVDKMQTKMMKISFLFTWCCCTFVNQHVQSFNKSYKLGVQ